MNLSMEQQISNTINRAEREKLLPIAEAYANRVVGPKPKTAQGTRTLYNWGVKWNSAFLGMMDKLCQEKGLMK